MKLFGFMIVALWLASASSSSKDARRRIVDPVLIGVAVATAIVFPFVGVLIDVILRPPEYLDDVRERELEIRAMERRLGADHRCPYCRSEIESSFLDLPGLHVQAEERVPPLQGAARAALEGLPVFGETEVRSDEPVEDSAPTSVLPRVGRRSRQQASQSP